MQYVQIKQCESQVSDNTTSSNYGCTYHYQHNETDKDIHFDCIVSGVRGNLNLHWTGAESLGTVTFEHMDQEDGTYDVKSTLTVDSELLKGNSNFSCVAQGQSVNGTVEQTIQVLGGPGKFLYLHKLVNHE